MELAIEALPENQRAVITLRDLEGLSSEEGRNVSGFRRQQRVLPTAHGQVRAAFERYLEEDR